MHKRNLVLLLAMAPLAGCMTLGSNVSGSFSCDAPDGVCAPATALDDAALAQIVKGDETSFGTAAGLYEVDDGDGPKAVVAARAAEANQRYKLSVVFPGYIDATGVSHERKVVQTDVGLPGRTASGVELAQRAKGRNTERGLLAAAENAPPLLAGQLSEGLARPATSMAGDPVPNPIDRIKAEVDAKLSAGPRRQAAPFPSAE